MKIFDLDFCLANILVQKAEIGDIVNKLSNKDSKIKYDSNLQVF